ncbi:GGDEF domain-containing protein [Desulfobacterales bacterium HSG2]|nr:GGDEF domain-containing protein [Desulfobacterales bacterium HSG2]
MSESEKINLNEIIKALDIVLTERTDEDCFHILGHIPSWYQRIFPEFYDAEKNMVKKFCPFIENFLIDATPFWLSEADGRLNSGLWIENDSHMTECPLEASAINIGKRKFLLIERGKIPYEENKSILQKSRELSLSYLYMERLQKQLLIAIYTDRLTGLHNRRKFDEMIKIEKERATRYNIPFSIVFIDIDHFKKINDTYGHDVGDQVLIEISSVLKSRIRITDWAFRWGGEEFILLLPVTSADKSLDLAERLRFIIENHSFPHGRQLTISAGVAQFRNDESIDNLIKRADEALYRAKSGGRNKVLK